MKETSIFHAYDIRGVYPKEISIEDAYRIGWAFAKFLKTNLKIKPPSGGPLEVVLGMDMRGSSPFLARELIRSFNDQGIDAEIFLKLQRRELNSYITERKLIKGFSFYFLFLFNANSLILFFLK